MAVRSRFVMAVSFALLALACGSKDEGIDNGSGGTGGVGGGTGGSGGATGGSGGATGGSAGTGGTTGGSAGTGGATGGSGGSSGSGGTTGGSAGSGGTAGKGGTAGAAGTGGSAGTGGAGGSTDGGAGAGGSAGTGGAGGAAGTDGGTGGMPPGETMGCPGSKLYTLPEDTGTRGPWAVGAKTITVQGLATEVWYPAKRGSEAGQTTIQYDIRKWLPLTEQTKIPDVDNPWQPCDCYRDLPLDTDHGPYPVVVFIHGTAAWRAQSVQLVQHWASRGFVVVSSDHPGLFLGDYLDFKLGANLVADTDKLIADLKTTAGELAFLSGHIDMARLGMSGHSAGGGGVSGYGAQAQVIIPLASGGVTAGAALKGVLVMGGQADMIARYTGQQSGFNTSPSPKRLVGVKNAGHLNFSDICAVGKDKGGLLAIAQKYMVKNANLAGFLFDCSDTQLPPADGWPVINRATSAALESVLHCSTTAAKSFDSVKTDPNVGEYKEML
jgi:predicted dienelactone hydrolase